MGLGPLGVIGEVGEPLPVEPVPVSAKSGGKVKTTASPRVPPLTAEELERLAALEAKETTDDLKWRWAEDVMWCYRHLESPSEAARADLRTRTAWTMLHHARQDKAGFIAKNVKEAAATLQKRTERVAIQEAERRGEVQEDEDETRRIKQLESMLIAAVKKSQALEVRGNRVVEGGGKKK